MQRQAQKTKRSVKAFEEAVDIKRLNFLPNVKGTIENHLSMTQNAMVQPCGWLLTNQYDFQPKQLEVMPTESDDVIQFWLF